MSKYKVGTSHRCPRCSGPVQAWEADEEISSLRKELAMAKKLVAKLLDYEGAEGFDKPVRDSAHAFLRRR